MWSHPPYSPDLAPCNYHLFGPLKQYLGGQHLANDDDVKEEVLKWLKESGQNFYESGTEKHGMISVYKSLVILLKNR